MPLSWLLSSAVFCSEKTDLFFWRRLVLGCVVHIIRYNKQGLTSVCLSGRENSGDQIRFHPRRRRNGTREFLNPVLCSRRGPAVRPSLLYMFRHVRERHARRGRAEKECPLCRVYLSILVIPTPPAGHAIKKRTVVQYGTEDGWFYSELVELGTLNGPSLSCERWLGVGTI